MNMILKINLLILSSLLYTNIFAQKASTTLPATLSKGPSERFIGNVWVQYFVNDTISNFLSSKVIFEPNARSNWHVHTGRQIIFAIEGSGFYKEKEKAIRILNKGDVVIIEPGTIHSHGSSKTNSFTQAVMMNNVNRKDATTWLNPVKEEEL
jgi:4-carboxymuconolactone decarboxylase